MSVEEDEELALFLPSLDEQELVRRRGSWTFVELLALIPDGPGTAKFSSSLGSITSYV